jgi:hypothetical protein
MKKITLFLLLLPLFALQCKKDKDKNDCPNGDKACELAKLPPLTTTSENTFGCLINGEALLPKGTWGANGIQFDFSQTIFSLKVNNFGKSNIKDTKHFAINGIQFKTIYNQEKEIRIYYSNQINECSIDSRDTSSYIGNLTFERFDTLTRVFSGSFEFTLFPDSNSEDLQCETIFITHGRFDLKD